MSHDTAIYHNWPVRAEVEPDNARLRLLRVSPELLVEMCKPGPPRYAEVVENSLPPDTRCVRLASDPYGPVLYLVLTSQEFAEVPEGAPIPEWPQVSFRLVSLEKTYDRKAT